MSCPFVTSECPSSSSCPPLPPPPSAVAGLTTPSRANSSAPHNNNNNNSSSSAFDSKVRRKRKLLSQGGQKWFKGSPRKGSRLTNPVLHTEKAPQEALIPSTLVLFTFADASERRLSIYDALHLIEEGREEEKRLKKHHHHHHNRVSSNNDEGGDSSSAAAAALQQPLHVRSGEGAEEAAPIKLPQPTFRELGGYSVREVGALPNAYIRWMEMPEEEEETVEYDVDEEDTAWLELLNRRGRTRVSVGVLELLMDRLEKESYLRMQSEGGGAVIDDDAVCCICMDGECQNSNAILFCDMCNLAVHQECYGVPYIPEGQWLCRRCLQSPSRAVDCVLCPNKGGAFKQTDDGRWAHVVCAIWIPEVCFANTVFLEPVDSVGNIPPARWRLCCFICKYKGRGACIQCHKSNCYTAFHVTCAQYAGLCMKMDTVRVGGPHGTLTVRKTAYCDNHAPPDFIRNRDGDSPSVRQKLKACRKMLAEKRSALPMVSIPTIPPERLNSISESANVPRNSPLLKHLLSYWKLKRIQRNGVPLLRRLQAASSHPPVASSHPHIHTEPAEYKFVMRLRQDLERARLLCELIRKREKTKRELVAVTEEWWEMAHRPLAQLLHSILDEISAKDTQCIFMEPVDEEEVPDYRSVVHNPMDISTMRANINAFRYSSVHDLFLDFKLMIDNCLLYNSKDTVFYRTALRLHEQGGIIFREAEKIEERTRYDHNSLLHLSSSPEATSSPPPPPPPPPPPVRVPLPPVSSPSKTTKKTSSLCDTNTTTTTTTTPTSSRRKPRGRPPCRRSRRLPPSSPPLKATSHHQSSPQSQKLVNSNYNNNNELVNGMRSNGPGDSFSKYRDTNSSDEEEEVQQQRGASGGDSDSSQVSSEGEEEEEDDDDDDEEGDGGGGGGGGVHDSSSSVSSVGSGNDDDDDDEEEENDESGRSRSQPQHQMRSRRGKEKKKENNKQNAHQVESPLLSLTDEDDDEDDEEEEVELEPLQLVWATQESGGKVWSPGLIVDPDMRGELVQNGVAIPAPPAVVLGRRPPQKKKAFLVLFFDNHRTWEWKLREELEPLGVHPSLDKARLEETNKPGEKKRVQRAYEKALLHRTQVRAGLSRVQTP